MCALLFEIRNNCKYPEYPTIVNIQNPNDRDMVRQSIHTKLYSENIYIIIHKLYVTYKNNERGIYAQKYKCN